VFGAVGGGPGPAGGVPDCTDLDQLDNWVRRAATITKIEDLER
jgi:hypothetical protein